MNQNTPARAPNVGDIRWLGAKFVMLLCQKCPYQQVSSLELLPDDAPLAHLAAKFVCPQCHNEGAYVLPNWGLSAPDPPHDA
jgi:hypothetical protein